MSAYDALLGTISQDKTAKTDPDLELGSGVNVTGGITATPNSVTGKIDFKLGGRQPLVLSVGPTLTIASGVITITHSIHAVDTEGGAGSDDLTSILGATAGQVLILYAANGAHTVVVKDAGNQALAGDCSLDNADDRLVLLYLASNWAELARSNNGT